MHQIGNVTRRIIGVDISAKPWATLSSYAQGLPISIIRKETG